MKKHGILITPILVGALLIVSLFLSFSQPVPTVNAQVCEPSVSIAKEIEGDDLRIFPNGSDIPFQITIQNTGNVELTNIQVLDPLVPDCERTFESLDVGETISYSCTAMNVIQGFMNTAKVVADSECGGANDYDISTVELADIEIRKQEKGEDERLFPPGSDIPYTIVVTNTGDTVLTDIVVTDELVPSCSFTVASLEPGEFATHECTAENVTEGFRNVAVVTATSGQTTVTDDDPSTVNIPGIDIRKQAEGGDTRAFPPGSDVTFEIVVTNTGDVDLINVEVIDSITEDCNYFIESLPVGESVSYTCTATNVTEGFTNIAKVTGEADDIVVTDQDPSTVQISDEKFKIYLPFVSKSGIIKYNVSFGYEDLRLNEANDFDYNDWVISIETTFDYSSINDTTINLSRVSFGLTPKARGALLAHEYHISFPRNTFGSNGSATLNVFDSNGNVISTTQTAFTASQRNDFHVFDRTSDAIPPSGSLVNTVEGTGPNPAAQTAELTIDFDSPFPFVLTDYGPHGEGLFFEPYLQVIPAGSSRYDIGNGDIRTIVFPILDWRWPEEHIRIDNAYPGITYVGPPDLFVFPDNWWLNFNECIYGDGVVCPVLNPLDWLSELQP